ncbi:MAG: hypothetical protein UHS32_08075 [Bacteroidaceae bacterium]|jgi:hypothetical protein|nr:hypothetical protein [Bacteroidaceae bacterium]MEE1146715.1 hypothetical protein [Bacteroidaceae bacterium]
MSTELQQLNEQTKLAMWAGRISECRNSGLTVKRWCKENGVGEQTYYKWQKRVFALAKAQHETQFAEVTPVVGMRGTASVAMTIHVAGVSADIHNGADPSTVEAVLQILKRC